MRTGSDELKDLITSIGSITILMIFILQFASNQALVSKFAFSDVIVEKYADSFAAENSEEAQRELKRNLTSVLGCSNAEVRLETGADGTYTVSAPVRDVIACGKLLGISDEDNKVIYKKTIKAEQ